MCVFTDYLIRTTIKTELQAHEYRAMVVNILTLYDLESQLTCGASF